MASEQYITLLNKQTGKKEYITLELNNNSFSVITASGIVNGVSYINAVDLLNKTLKEYIRNGYILVKHDFFKIDKNKFKKVVDNEKQLNNNSTQQTQFNF